MRLASVRSAPPRRDRSRRAPALRRRFERPHLSPPAPSSRSDAAAAGADGADVEHRDADGVAGDFAARRQVQFSGDNHRDIGARATDIDRDNLGVAPLSREATRADHARGGPGKKEADRSLGRAVERGDPATRLHDLHLGADALGSKSALKLSQEAFHPRAEVGALNAVTTVRSYSR